MTENASLADQVIRPTYDQIRDSIPDSGVREKWQAADNVARRARDEMQRVHADANLSEEGKKEAAQAVIDRHAASAIGHYQGARERAKRSAQSAYEFSIPLPDGQCYATSQAKDSSEMVAIQNEAERIARELSGKSLQQLTKEVSKNPNDRGAQGEAGSKAQALRDEYEKAMHRGGLEGKVLAHAVLRIADASGLDKDAIVDDFRGERHRRYVEESQQINALSASIPSGNDLTQNPYGGTRRPGARGVGTYGSANRAALMGSGRPQLFQKQKRRPPWK